MSLAKDSEPLSVSAPVWDDSDDIEIPPCDLWSDEPPLESDLHLRQIMLLIQSLEHLWHDRNDFYATGNLTIYYSPEHIKSRDFKGPDFFVVLGTERRPRKSWVVWAEGGLYPNLIVEILSNSTATIDRNAKKQLYQDIFRTPDYFWFHPETLEFAGFHLTDGQYQPLPPNSQGWLWSQQLQLFLGVHQQQLRFFTPEGQLVQTPEEAAAQAQTSLAQTEISLAQAEALLARYREQFGELPES